MKYTVGPFLVLETNPPQSTKHKHEHGPPVPGNQATWLFFPILAALILVLIAALSDPIFHGLSIVDVDMGKNGRVQFGAWGWCGKNIPNITDQCGPMRGFASSMENELSRLPEPVKMLQGVSAHLPRSYLVANGVFSVFSVMVAWLTACMTLAASGFWQSKDQGAWDWTRWAFAGSFWSSLISLISLGLTVGQVSRVKDFVSKLDVNRPTVIPGPVIWMLLAAFILELGSFIYRVSYGKFRARPFWTFKGDNARVEQPPNSATKPPQASGAGEQPPTWESLQIDGAVLADEKAAYDRWTAQKLSVAV